MNHITGADAIAVFMLFFYNKIITHKNKLKLLYTFYLENVSIFPILTQAKILQISLYLYYWSDI